MFTYRIPEKETVTEEKRDFKTCLEERFYNIKTICDQHQDALKWQKTVFERHLRNHVWDFPNQLVYCPIAKVASSTWFTNFVKLLNIDLEKLEYLKQARIPLTREIPFVRTNDRGIIIKIETRPVLRNMATMARDWAVNDLKQV